MNKFDLKHITLYAKNWYKRSDNIIEDLCKCLQADGYIINHKSEVFSMLLNRLNSINYLTSDKAIQAINESSPDQCWKCGYYINTNTWRNNYETYPIYDYQTSFIYWCLSEISIMDKNQCEITIPNNKVLPVPKGNINKAKELLN